MSITISLGFVTVDQRTLDKRLNFTDSVPVDITAKLKDNCSVMQPIFLLTASVVDIVNYNYCYVSDWGRYYFIRNVITMPGGRIELRCAEDVLTSNADAIKEITGTVGRQEAESMRDPYLQDPKMLKKSKTYTQNLHFDKDPFTLGDGAFGDQVHYILAVVGGNGSSTS